MKSRPRRSPVLLTLGFTLAIAVAVATPATAQSHFSGSIGPGSFYEIDVPLVWNGDLVLYAHGIVQAEEPVAPPANRDGYAALRAALLAGGYAVAASSFSSNGWSLDDAVRRTHQLSGIFKSKAGQARRTFLLNAGVQRFNADRGAINDYQRNYAPTGRIGIPVLTLHTTRDPGIPFTHEGLFAATVNAAGRGGLLLERPIDRWGHCAFTAAEMQNAFTDLVQWVTTGQRP